MHALTTLLILCAFIVTAQVQAPSPALPHDKPRGKSRVRLSCNRGGWANLYGNSDLGVVLAHGGRFTKESWQPQAQCLVKAGFRVLAFDFRGFGRSHGPGDSDKR
jgi:pimeloyl-ACP methyl ester carboxylesterase